MMKLVGIGIANYCSIGEEPVWIDLEKKVNLLIGPNNSGKSNVIDALRWFARSEVEQVSAYQAETENPAEQHTPAETQLPSRQHGQVVQDDHRQQPNAQTGGGEGRRPRDLEPEPSGGDGSDDGDDVLFG